MKRPAQPQQPQMSRVTSSGSSSASNTWSLAHIKRKVTKLAGDSWWLGSHVAWTTVTAAIVLAVPVFFEYEKECQMFEQMQQMQAAQMHAAEQAAASSVM